jgi:DNA-binding transcriptional LysR family regulator
VIETRKLQYFLVLAEELHFGKAAERLHIVQSAVSQQIRSLERELGVSLFDRTTRTVALTEAGQRLIPYAETVLTDIRALTDALGGPGQRVVRLGTATGLGERLDRILETFATAAPGVRLDLVHASTPTRARQVKSGLLDAAILRSGRRQPGLELIPLWEDRLVAALPERHALVAGSTVAFARLAGLPLRLASRARNPQLHALVTSCCRRAGFEPIFGPEFTTDQDTLAEIGHGPPSWTVYYASQVVRLAAPGVAFLALCDPDPVSPVYLAVRSGRRGRHLDALVEACRAAVD